MYAVQSVRAVNYSPRSNAGRVWTVHYVVSPLRAGFAVSIARNWFGVPQPPGRESSAHWVFDPANSVLMVPEEQIAWHCGGGNFAGVGAEHAADGSTTRAQYLSDAGIAMLRRSAERAAAWMRPRGVPTVRINAGQTRNGAKGVNDHNTMRLAFGGTTHTDVLDSSGREQWPWDVYLALIDEYKTGAKGFDGMSKEDAVAGVDEWMRGRHDLPGGDKAVTPIEAFEQWPAMNRKLDQFGTQLGQVTATLEHIVADVAKIGAALTPQASKAPPKSTA
jgi:hypothetical protein